MKAERQYKKSPSRTTQSKGKNCNFVDKRSQSIVQANVINVIQQKEGNKDDFTYQLKNIIGNFNNPGQLFVLTNSQERKVTQRAIPDFSDKEIKWIKRGDGIEKHCPWTMTYLAIIERPEEIMPTSSTNKYGQKIYKLIWPQVLYEEFGNSNSPKAKSWKDGYILFSYDAYNKRAYVFHSGPGG